MRGENRGVVVTCAPEISVVGGTGGGGTLVPLKCVSCHRIDRQGVVVGVGVVDSLK